MIYLDNAATSFPKPDNVLYEMFRCMQHYCANPGRGGHDLSIQSGRAVAAVRSSIASFFNCPNPLTICFTKNATEAINTGLKGVLKEGDHVITTSLEHNSVIRPLKTMEKQGKITLTVISATPSGEIDPEQITKAATPRTRLVICTYASNVSGILLPVKEISDAAHRIGSLFMLDASQGAGTSLIDVQDLDLDMMAFPGHKGLLGPQGTGGLYIREGMKLDSIIEGGTGSRSESLYQPDFPPDRFEAGTLNTPGIVGLGEGIRFIQRTGIVEIHKHIQKLVDRLVEGLSEIKGIRFYNPLYGEKNVGIVAVNLGDMDSNEVGYLLDKKFGIAVRAGLHCAPLAHMTFNTMETGIVRFSPGYFNTMDDIEGTILAMKMIAKGV